MHNDEAQVGELKHCALCPKGVVKAIHFFSPREWKQRSPRCRECIRKQNQKAKPAVIGRRRDNGDIFPERRAL